MSISEAVTGALSGTAAMAGGSRGTRSSDSGIALVGSGSACIPYLPERAAREQECVESADGGGVEHQRSARRCSNAMEKRDAKAQAGNGD